MSEIYIHKAYKLGELEDLFNPHLAEKLDGVVMHWDNTTSLMIVKLHNVSIEEVMCDVQEILGNEVKLSLDPEY